MFQSKERKIAVPQSEHARLAAIIALHWGNKDFDKPALDFDSFVEGVAFHDWAYGINDNLPLGAISREKWIDIAKKGSQLDFQNPIVEIVVKLHIKRLISGADFLLKDEIMTSIDLDINEKIKSTKHSLEDFLWADRITDFCDMLAFDFSFETKRERKISVYPEKKSKIQKQISFEICEDGIVKVNPWPFSVSEINGFIYSYESENYPQKLIPRIMKYSIINPG